MSVIAPEQSEGAGPSTNKALSAYPPTKIQIVDQQGANQINSPAWVSSHARLPTPQDVESFARSYVLQAGVCAREEERLLGLKV